MPIWLRKFTFKEIKDFYEEEKKEYEKSTKKGNTTNLLDSSGKLNPSKLPQFSKGFKPKTSYK